jgi:hypothetical protein
MQVVRCQPFFNQDQACPFPMPLPPVALSSPTTQTTVTDGLLFFSNMESYHGELGSLQITDLSGSSNHGTWTNANLAVGAGVAGGSCFTFGDSESYMELPRAVIVSGASDRTICHYIKRKAGVNLDHSNYAFGFGMYLAAQMSDHCLY